MAYSREFQQKIDQLLINQNKLEVLFAELRSSMMPRHEIDAEIEKRVAISAYASDKANYEERFKRLEDAPSATWARAGILISGSIGCLGLLMACVTLIVTIMIATHLIG